MTDESETYLGDGLYGHMEGYSLFLRAPREGGNHWVGLEPEVLLEALRLVKATRPEMLGRVLKELRD